MIAVLRFNYVAGKKLQVYEDSSIIQILSESKRYWSSEEGRRANALALGAEEGRDKLRKATGSRK